MITIEADLCDLCGSCIAVCPALALRLTANNLRFDPSVCKGCLVCARVCPVGAIKAK